MARPAKTEIEHDLREGVKIASPNSYTIDFYYQRRRCRETVKRPVNKKNDEYMNNLKGEIDNKIADGTFRYSHYFAGSKTKNAKAFMAKEGVVFGDATLGKLLDDFIEREKTSLAPVTHRCYAGVVKNHLKPHFGHLQPKELKMTTVSNWLAKCGLAKKTRRNVLTPLRLVLDEAVIDGLVSENVLDKLKPFKQRRKQVKGQQAVKDDALGLEILKTLKEEGPVDPFSPEEIDQLLASFLDRQDRNFYGTAFTTGLRPSEEMGLHWTDIDFDARTIKVQRAIVEATIKETKTAAGVRTVKMLDAAYAFLKDQWELTGPKDGEQPGWVFLNPKSSGRQPYMRSQALYPAWVAAMEHSGLRYRRPYQTRHTWASTMITMGEPIAWVAVQMGHANWEMIARVYARFIPSVTPDAGVRGNAVWSVFSQKFA